MAHYAFLDENNIVTEVIVGKDETDLTDDWEKVYGDFRGQKCKRTSYNTYLGIYYTPNTRTPDPDQTKAFRKNFAGIGMTYDESRDAFIYQKTFPSWTFNEFSCSWDAPIPYPTDGESYYWDEDKQSWEKLEPKS